MLYTKVVSEGYNLLNRNYTDNKRDETNITEWLHLLFKNAVKFLTTAFNTK